MKEFTEKKRQKTLALIPIFNTMSEKIRSLLDIPELDDKVICFIPKWEKHKLAYDHSEYFEQPYLLDESRLFFHARKYLFENQEFCFYVYRTFERDGSSSAQSPEEKTVSKATRSLFKSKNARKYHELTFALDQLVDHFITIIPMNANSKEYLRSQDIADSSDIHILCIDYSKLSGGILQKFLAHEATRFEKRKKLADQPLFDLFNEASFGVYTESMMELAEIINDAYSKELSEDQQDDMEFLSSNHVQNLPIPDFWERIPESGYVCEYNKDLLKKRKAVANEQKQSQSSDFRLFYSLESLLFWELRQRLKKIKRCATCHKPLPRTINNKYFKGNHCPLNTECRKARNREKQRRFRKNQSDL